MHHCGYIQLQTEMRDVTMEKPAWPVFFRLGSVVFHNIGSSCWLHHHQYVGLPLMSNKHYTVHFYQIDAFGVADPDVVIRSLFSGEIQRVSQSNLPTVAKSAAGYDFELRELVEHLGVITGCLALLRSDAPHLRDHQGTERPVQTNPGDLFLEKNYFIYYAQTRVLAWQFNLAANHINNLGLMLTALTGNATTVVCTSIIDTAFAYDPNSEIEYVDFRVRAPRNQRERAAVQNLRPDDWGTNPFETMAQTNASTMQVVLRTRRQSLDGRVRRMINALLGSEQTRRLRVKVSDAEEPIDLLAKRIKRRIAVQMNGLYPVPQSVLQELQAAKDDCNDEIARNI
jgi:hypothetical protein